MAPALETRKLCKSFGALTVADKIDFRLEPGARHALIGPNGAGKTTFVNMLMGALAPSSGQILLGGEDVTHVPQSTRVRRGLGRTFQVTSLFRSLPLLDNVALGVAEREGTATRMWKPASRHSEIKDEAMEHLAKRYPYLVDDSGTPPDPDASELVGSRSANRKKVNVTDEASLEKRFPAMRRR